MFTLKQIVFVYISYLIPDQIPDPFPRLTIPHIPAPPHPKKMADFAFQESFQCFLTSTQPFPWFQ